MNIPRLPALIQTNLAELPAGDKKLATALREPIEAIVDAGITNTEEIRAALLTAIGSSDLPGSIRGSALSRVTTEVVESAKGKVAKALMAAADSAKDVEHAALLLGDGNFYTEQVRYSGQYDANEHRYFARVENPDPGDVVFVGHFKGYEKSEDRRDGSGSSWTEYQPMADTKTTKLLIPELEPGEYDLSTRPGRDAASKELVDEWVDNPSDAQLSSYIDRYTEILEQHGDKEPVLLRRGNMGILGRYVEGNGVATPFWPLREHLLNVAEADYSAGKGPASMKRARALLDSGNRDVGALEGAMRELGLLTQGAQRAMYNTDNNTQARDDMTEMNDVVKDLSKALASAE